MGVNTWDTANVYSNGESEEIIGKALKKYNIPRDKVVILTKCFGAVGESPEFRSTSLGAYIPKSKDYINHYGSYSLTLSPPFTPTNLSLFKPKGSPAKPSSPPSMPPSAA